MPLIDPAAQNAFNHALYLFVGHWAAYVAALGLLATLGMMLSTTPGIHHRGMCVAGVALGLFMSWYFLWGMLEFWHLMVASNLMPLNYSDEIPLPLRPNFSGPGGAMVSLLLASGNFWLLLRTPELPQSSPASTSGERLTRTTMDRPNAAETVESPSAQGTDETTASDVP